MLDNTLLLKLLDTELTALQKQIVEDYLFNLLVEDKAKSSLSAIKCLVTDHLNQTTYQQQLEELRSYLTSI
jgi:hypothetical protein